MSYRITVYLKMLDLLRKNLPSGLTTIRIGNDEWTQKVSYQCSARPKCDTTSPKSTPRAPVTTARHVKTKAVIEQMLPHFEELYELYNDHLKEDALRRFGDHVSRFVGSDPGLSLVGSRRSREVLAYISNGIRLHKPPPPSFWELCSFLLNANIHIDGKVFKWDGIELSKDIVLDVRSKK
jgi:hypothetical protein